MSIYDGRSELYDRPYVTAYERTTQLNEINILTDNRMDYYVILTYRKEDYNIIRGAFGRRRFMQHKAGEIRYIRTIDSTFISLYKDGTVGHSENSSSLFHGYDRTPIVASELVDVVDVYPLVNRRFAAVTGRGEIIVWGWGTAGGVAYKLPSIDSLVEKHRMLYSSS